MNWQHVRGGLILIFFSLSMLQAVAQGVGIGTVVPHRSAVLDVAGNKGGILIPRLKMNERDNIADPAMGLLIFLLDDNSFYYYDGGWKRLAIAGNTWDLQGNNGTNSGTHFIGTTDTAALSFRVNNVPRMQLFSNGRVNLMGNGRNTSIGASAGLSLAAGVDNVYIGIVRVHWLLQRI